jgi:hypothetical protein
MAPGYRGSGRYSMPYDSTQGVPDGAFIGIWIIILLFCLRLAWEFRDKIFKKKRR